MPVNKNCEYCGKCFSVPPARANKARFCGKGCADAAQTTSTRHEFTCEHCTTKFKATLDHGKPRRFCSRTCFEAKAQKPEHKLCPICDSYFLAHRSSHDTQDGLRTYCSSRCAKEGLKRGRKKACINCGVEFYQSPAQLRQRKEESCCSQQCQREYYRFDRNPTWKGGNYVDTGTGHVRTLFPRNGFTSPYISEHRIIASKTIGRMLEPHEMVIHINNIGHDNRPENLFICGSNSEMSRRRQGSLPWPDKSNLNTYK